MFRHIIILFSLLLISVTTSAQESLPIIEIKADRTVIYPQRMELTGQESLMDMLQMMPDLMIAGYDELITSYSLRIDNVQVSGDKRLILSQMKAKDIERIQVCDNTGVAKGTIGMGKVLDINMKISAGLNGFAQGQADLGKDVWSNGTVNALYGSKGTDIYANAAYLYREGNREHVTLHMTNRFDDSNRLLTYFNQQHIERPNNNDEFKVMDKGRQYNLIHELYLILATLFFYAYMTPSKEKSLAYKEFQNKFKTNNKDMYKYLKYHTKCRLYYMVPPFLRPFSTKLGYKYARKKGIW